MLEKRTREEGERGGRVKFNVRLQPMKNAFYANEIEINLLCQCLFGTIKICQSRIWVTHTPNYPNIQIPFEVHL